ncbi:MAG: hypothetical protein JWQ04_1762 [Pedosphaera sp.]|nr:hypothetical protein [Pedosphaera sp.]
MKKYWFIALVGLAAGCKTAGHHEAYEGRPPAPMAGAVQPRHGGMGPIMGPAGSPAVVYYHEASQRLAEARRDGYISNDQFADLLEHLQGDLRQIMVAEAESERPMHPMPMPMPMHRPPRHEHEHGDE